MFFFLNLDLSYRWYTCLSILLGTFNYRAGATFGPSTLNYSLNGAVNAW